MTAKQYGTRPELAYLLGKTERRISQLVEEGILKTSTRGRYDLPLNIKLYTEFKVKEATAEIARLGTDAARLLRNRADEMELRVQTAKLNLAVKSGELLEWKRLLGFIGGRRRAFVRQLRLIPNKFAPRLATETDPAAIEHLLLAEIDEVLNVMGSEDAATRDYAAKEAEHALERQGELENDGDQAEPVPEPGGGAASARAGTSPPAKAAGATSRRY